MGFNIYHNAYYSMWNIDCTLSGDQELISGISEVYMNVVNEVTGDIYTYPLVIDSLGNVTGRCYYFDGQWSFGETRIMKKIAGEKDSSFQDFMFNSDLSFRIFFS